jgi:hypothetical protein
MDRSYVIRVTSSFPLFIDTDSYNSKLNYRGQALSHLHDEGFTPNDIQRALEQIPFVSQNELLVVSHPC